MKTKLAIGARVLLGLVFVVFGSNGFLHFFHQPPMSGAPANLVGAMIDSGYLFYLVMATEVVGGALLLSGRFVPLGLAILAPVIVNIVLFHLFLAPSGLGLAGVVLALELFLAWSYRSAFRPMLGAHVAPDRGHAKAAGFTVPSAA